MEKQKYTKRYIFTEVTNQEMRIFLSQYYLPSRPIEVERFQQNKTLDQQNHLKTSNLSLDSRHQL